MLCMHMCSAVSDSATLWTAAHQAPLSMGFSREDYWSELPFPPPGDLPWPGIEPPTPPALAGGCFPTEPPGKPVCCYNMLLLRQLHLALSDKYVVSRTRCHLIIRCSLPAPWPSQNQQGDCEACILISVTGIPSSLSKPECAQAVDINFLLSPSYRPSSIILYLHHPAQQSISSCVFSLFNMTCHPSFPLFHFHCFCPSC